MRFLRFVILCLCANLCATAVPAKTQPTLVESARYATADAGTEEYLLGPGDKVRITVFNEPTLSGDYSVNATGAMSLPLIGEVVAAGKTSAAVAEQVRAALTDGYLRSPTVTGEVVVYRPFFILGEVKSPGQYPYATGLTIYNAIATAQGFTPRAGRKTVYIRSSGSNVERSFRLTPDLKVLPGDTVRIGERYF